MEIQAKALRAVSSEAARLYVDEPLDYKGRSLTPAVVKGAWKSPHYMHVIAMTVENTKGSKILDVGISYGIYATVLKRIFGFDIYGIDHPENIKAYCRFPIQQGIPVVPCDLHFDQIPYPKATFNTVVAAEIVEHLLLSPKAFFLKLRPVLKPGGRLIVTTPNFANLRNILYLIKGLNPAGTFPDEAVWKDRTAKDNRVHPREYTVKEIRNALLDTGFEIGKIETVNKILKADSRVRAKMLNCLMRFTPMKREQMLAIGIKK